MIRLFFTLFLISPLLAKSQISITPKMGFEYGCISYYPKTTQRNNDIKIAVPEGTGFLSLEISKLKKKEKLSLAIEKKTLSVGITIFDDSTTYLDGYRGRSVYGTFSGSNHLFIGIFYDRVNNFFPSSKRFSYFYGGGLGIGINWTKEYYCETQDAGYSLTTWGGTNFARIERWTQPTGHGIFLKLRGGIAFHSKKGREAILLEIYWNQGFRKMQEHTVNYSYGGTLPPPGRNKTVSGYRFNSRGTTFGSTIGFPIYFSKTKKIKK